MNHHRRRSALLAAALLSLASLAQAQTDQRQFTSDTAVAEPFPPAAAASDETAAATEPAAFGSASRAWVELQASGSAAVASSRPLPGEVADAVYQRYLKSFSHEIPEQFKRQEQGQGGGGSSN